MREISYGIEGYSPYQDDDLEDYSNISDLGDLDLNNSEDVGGDFLYATKNIPKNAGSARSSKKENNDFCFIGGEHSISYGQIVSYLKQYSDMVLIHLDAHADLRDGYEGITILTPQSLEGVLTIWIKASVDSIWYTFRYS